MKCFLLGLLSSPICGLPHMLKRVGIGQQPLLLAPAMSCQILIKELPNVEHSGCKWTNEELQHYPNPFPGSHQPLHEVLGSSMTAIGEGAYQQPPAYFLLFQAGFTVQQPICGLPHGINAVTLAGGSVHHLLQGWSGLLPHATLLHPPLMELMEGFFLSVVLLSVI